MYALVYGRCGHVWWVYGKCGIRLEFSRKMAVLLVLVAPPLPVPMPTLAIAWGGIAGAHESFLTTWQQFRMVWAIGAA